MNMKLLAVLCLPLLLATPAKAQMSAGFSFNSYGGNSFYFAIGRNYSIPQQQVVYIHELRIPDEELPVVFFIADQAGVLPEEVANLRLAGYSWMDITLYYDLSPAIYYVVLDGDPGLEYGRAYGYWRQPRAQWNYIRFDDDDIIKMVNLRFVSTHYGVRPDEVVRLRHQQPDFIRVTQVVTSPIYLSSHATARRHQSAPEWQQQSAPDWQPQSTPNWQTQSSTARQQPSATVVPQQPTARQQHPATVWQQPPVTFLKQPTVTFLKQPTVTDRQQRPRMSRALPPVAVRQQPPATVRQQPPATVRQQPKATVRQQPAAAVKQQRKAPAKKQPSATTKKQPDGTNQDRGNENGSGRGNESGKSQNDDYNRN